MNKLLFRNLILFIFLLASSVNLSAATGVAIVVPADHAAPATDKVGVPSISEIVKSFKSLPRSERKARIKEVKKVLRDYMHQKKSGPDNNTSSLLIIIVTILIPPLGVFLYEGEITSHFWISLLLTLLFYIPGLIYSLLVVTDNI